MKMVKALISRGKIDAITRSLSSLGISGMTLCEVKCPADKKVSYQSVNAPDYESRVILEIAVNDDKVDELVNILSSDNIDPDASIDNICVLDIKYSIGIRTGEKSDKTL
jgi:nitrogen regulatory protein P-II 2